MPVTSIQSIASFFRLPESLFKEILPDLSAFVNTFPWDFSCKYEPSESKDDILNKLSEARRRQLVSEHTDLPVANDKRNIRLPNGFTAAISKTLVNHLVQKGICRSASMSGSLIYPPAGWMGWHTNSDREGWRLYVNYITGGGDSFLRWSQNGEIRTDYDTAGFNFRAFRVGNRHELFWHCIYADNWRFSLGHVLDQIDLRVLEV